MRQLQFPLQLQLRLPPAPLARNPYEKLRALGDVGGVVEVVRGLVDSPAGFALDPGD
jgi:hypothetical protein